MQWWQNLLKVRIKVQFFCLPKNWPGHKYSYCNSLLGNSLNKALGAPDKKIRVISQSSDKEFVW